MILTKKSFDIKKIKLVIWDLDNTFWKGIISEESIIYDKLNINIVNELNRHGIVNSICSKNDFEVCHRELSSSGLWDQFVFPSIDWSDKGQRLFQIINEMNLRPDNVLFLDDEPSNLHRALTVNDCLMCASIVDIQSVLLEQIQLLPVDSDFSRLKRYRELQEKSSSKKQFASDLAFLEQSEIRVYIKGDCHNHISRILELINRTNQLNYTKKRLEKNEVEQIINDKCKQCGYIKCIDKYSDYGIVGFYALDKTNDSLEHFLFSCRTIGMGVEQYVYSQIGFPKLTVIGDVVNELDDAYIPSWINNFNKHNNRKETDNNDKNKKTRILVKGPCDVSQITPYFSGGEFCEEFAYISEHKKGMFIESFNHTSQILYSKDLSESDKHFLISNVPFIDQDFYSTKIFKEKFDYIILSMLTDYSLGLYQCISRPELLIPFGQYTSDYTETEKWDNIQKVLTDNKEVSHKVSEEYERFRKDFKFVGRISDEQMISNLKRIRALLPKETRLVLINGAETEYPGVCKPSHLNRHILHRSLNRLLVDFVNENSDNCFLVDVNLFMKTDNPYLDTINHYKKEIYYQLACEIENIIIKTSNTNDVITRSNSSSKAQGFFSRLKGRVNRIIRL